MQNGILVLHSIEQTEIQYQIIRSYMTGDLQYFLLSTCKENHPLVFVRKPSREEGYRHFKHSSILRLPDAHFYIVLNPRISSIQESDRLASSLGAVLIEKGVIAS